MMVEEVLQQPENKYRYNAATGNTLAATLTTTLPIILCSKIIDAQKRHLRDKTYDI